MRDTSCLQALLEAAKLHVLKHGVQLTNATACTSLYLLYVTAAHSPAIELCAYPNQIEAKFMLVFLAGHHLV